MKVSTLIFKLTEFLALHGDNNDVILAINRNIHNEHIFSNSDINIIDYLDGTVGLYAHEDRLDEKP